MATVDATDFDHLRAWNGEQSRAFEEISYQLLKRKVPGGTRAIRTGNPDGGVEWYVTRPDGIEWGWQAKHVHGIDALLNAMTDSVKRVAKERPNLRKLTFAISSNLGTSKAPRKGKPIKRLARVAEIYTRAVGEGRHLVQAVAAELPVLGATPGSSAARPRDGPAPPS